MMVDFEVDLVEELKTGNEELEALRAANVSEIDTAKARYNANLAEVKAVAHTLYECDPHQ